MTVLHILAGTLALLSALMALTVTKGGNLHRRSGTAYVVAMLVMGLSGAAMAAAQGVTLSVVAGLLAAYLVVTGWLSVRFPIERMRAALIVGMLVAIAIGITAMRFGMQALGTPVADPTPESSGIPFIVFGSLALLGAALDARMLWVGHIAGRHRLARHLWRLLAALVMANAAFFLGQADEFPEVLREPLLLAAPVLVSLLLIPYWLVRVLRGRGVAGRPTRLRGSGA